MKFCILIRIKLNQYEEECSKNSKYIEADMAKNKIKEIKDKFFNIKKNTIKKEYLKDKIEVEKAYLQEYNNFKEKWRLKFDKFESKIKDSKKDMIDSQNNYINKGIKKIEENFIIKKKNFNNKILNLKKIEKTLAKQKNYLEALKIKDEWQKEEKIINDKLHKESEIKKKEFLDEAERKNSKDINLFLKHIEELRKNLEKEKENELKKINLKYDKIKIELDNIHNTETKVINNNKRKTNFFKNKENFEIKYNDEKDLKKSNLNKIAKKKVLLEKLNKTPLRKN